MRPLAPLFSIVCGADQWTRSLLGVGVGRIVWFGGKVLFFATRVRASENVVCLRRLEIMYVEWP